MQMLVGAALGLAVVGFFFVVTDGPTYVDILLVERDWKEADATIDRVIPGVGRDALTRFVFSYSVDESAFTSTCYGPDSLANESPVRARYDGNQPEVANLVGGWRAGGSPVLPMFFFAILLLIVIPLPIAIGHAIASLLAGNPTR